ncbi:MAG: hypothetical protein F4234_02600 [Gammaproteobacteria bacterium]|nr:hypothetical protein [Gammaproteobacteria bacterium]MYE99067.1 hypothetical protein [Gammaproteobacteria bacterium]MYG96803.1 hypothetical protein [Gammaproteobacteria bacterium]
MKQSKPLLEIFDSPKNDLLWEDENGKLQAKFRDDVEKVLEAFEVFRNEQRGDGKNLRLIRTRRSISERGGIAALDGIVNRKKAAMGFAILEEAGRLDLSFEKIVAGTHASLFDKDTVDVARKRLREK